MKVDINTISTNSYCGFGLPKNNRYTVPTKNKNKEWFDEQDKNTNRQERVSKAN